MKINTLKKKKIKTPPNKDEARKIYRHPNISRMVVKNFFVSIYKLV